MAVNFTYKEKVILHVMKRNVLNNIWMTTFSHWGLRVMVISASASALLSLTKWRNAAARLLQDNNSRITTKNNLQSKLRVDRGFFTNNVKQNCIELMTQVASLNNLISGTQFFFNY